MKIFFTKKLIQMTAVLITTLVVGCGVFINSASADILNPGPVMIIRTLTYTSNGHGTIQGVTPQMIINGGSGSTVVAVPSLGYKFSQWSDGVTTASRTDSNVVSSINVSATFVLNVVQFNPNPNLNPIPSQNLANIYTVTYSASGNHGVILGTNPQSVIDGGDGTEVTAVAKPHYIFDGWSDGLNSDTRTETNVLGDMNLVASFVHETLNNFSVSYLVTYNVPSGHGSIQGSASQWIPDGEDGTTVKAIPNSGYKFKEWSDGLETASRKDLNVTGDLQLTASFSHIASSGGNQDTNPQTADQILGSGVCPLNLTLTQNLKSGAHDGEYLKYNGGVVTQVAILQTQINRILAASYHDAAGPIDGRFGPLTKLGVQRLQLALVDILHADLGPKGADGIIGFYTRGAINNSCGGM